MASPIAPLHRNTATQTRAKIVEKPELHPTLAAAAASQSIPPPPDVNNAKKDASLELNLSPPSKVELVIPKPPPIPEPPDTRPIILRRGVAEHLTQQDVFELTTPHIKPSITTALSGYEKSNRSLLKSKINVEA